MADNFDIQKLLEIQLRIENIPKEKRNRIIEDFQWVTEELLRHRSRLESLDYVKGLLQELIEKRNAKHASDCSIRVTDHCDCVIPEPQ